MLTSRHFKSSLSSEGITNPNIINSENFYFVKTKKPWKPDIYTTSEPNLLNYKTYVMMNNRIVKRPEFDAVKMIDTDLEKQINFIKTISDESNTPLDQEMQQALDTKREINDYLNRQGKFSDDYRFAEISKKLEKGQDLTKAEQDLYDKYKALPKNQNFIDFLNKIGSSGADVKAVIDEVKNLDSTKIKRLQEEQKNVLEDMNATLGEIQTNTEDALTAKGSVSSGDVATLNSIKKYKELVIQILNIEKSAASSLVEINKIKDPVEQENVYHEQAARINLAIDMLSNEITKMKLETLTDLSLIPIRNKLFAMADRVLAATKVSIMQKDDYAELEKFLASFVLPAVPTGPIVVPTTPTPPAPTTATPTAIATTPISTTPSTPATAIVNSMDSAAVDASYPTLIDVAQINSVTGKDRTAVLNKMRQEFMDAYNPSLKYVRFSILDARAEYADKKTLITAFNNGYRYVSFNRKAEPIIAISGDTVKVAKVTIMSSATNFSLLKPLKFEKDTAPYIPMDELQFNIENIEANKRENGFRSVFNPSWNIFAERQKAINGYVANQIADNINKTPTLSAIKSSAFTPMTTITTGPVLSALFGTPSPVPGPVFTTPTTTTTSTGTTTTPTTTTTSTTSAASTTSTGIFGKIPKIASSLLPGLPGIASYSSATVPPIPPPPKPT